jgi:lysophospholipase L1-like esterase
MRKSILLVLIPIILLACKQKEEQQPTQQPVISDDTTTLVKVEFLALGDSYTIGQSVEKSLRWPLQLADKLATDGYEASEVEIIAKTGWTTGQLLDAIDDQNPEGPYDLVSLLIGVNNQYQKRDTAEYRAEFKMLLQKAIALSGNDPDKVFVVSIPDYSVTPYVEKMDTVRIRKQIDIFNLINLQETEGENISYVNITPISRNAKDDPTLIAGDDLHPSGKMYEQWVKMIYPVALEILEKQELSE